MTSSNLLNYLTNQIKVYERTEAKEIAFWLIEHFCGLSKLAILSDKMIDEQQVKDFNEIINRLNAHEPIQYILGETFFFGRKFQVNSAVLIPRPETEELVSAVIKIHKNSFPKPPTRILDMGTGSGCIAISLAKEIPQSEVVAWDISEKALAVAQSNAVLNQAKVSFEKKDILNLDSQNAAHQTFDIIVSNPPYVTQQEANEMRKNVLDFEPHLALFVPDETPLLFYETIAKFACKSLVTNGLLFLELNENYGKVSIELFQKYNFSEVEIVKDIHQKDRFLKAFWK